MIAYRILPEQVVAILRQGPARADIEIREGKSLFAEGPLPESPLLLGTIQQYDPDKVYTAEIALLRGTVGEVRSDPKEFTLFHRFSPGRNRRRS
jgi:hypothetical protein